MEILNIKDKQYRARFFLSTLCFAITILLYANLNQPKEGQKNRKRKKKRTRINWYNHQKVRFFLWLAPWMLIRCNTDKNGAFSKNGARHGFCVEGNCFSPPRLEGSCSSPPPHDGSCSSTLPLDGSCSFPPPLDEMKLLLSPSTWWKLLLSPSTRWKLFLSPPLDGLHRLKVAH